MAINKENKMVSFAFIIRVLCTMLQMFLSMLFQSHNVVLSLSLVHLRSLCQCPTIATAEHRGKKQHFLRWLALIFSYIFTIVCFSSASLFITIVERQTVFFSRSSYLFIYLLVCC